MSDFLQVVGFDPLVITAPQGAPGTAGTNGPAGVGVVSAAINGSNHLILTMSDASTIDAGLIPGGGGTVASVNTKTGTVVLTADDIGDGITFKAYSATDKTKLAAITGTNTGDETTATIKTKLGVTTLSGSNTGDQTVTLTGDVTGSGTGSFATALRATGTAGTYGDATHTVTLTTDAQGRVTAVTTNLITGSSFTRQLKTANYTAVLGDYVAADTTGGAFTVTLPAASGGKGTVVLKWVAGTLPPSIAAAGADHFDTSTGSTGGPFTLLNQAATYDSDGTSIWTVRNSFALSTLDTRYRSPSTMMFGCGTGNLMRVPQLQINAAAAAATLGKLIAAPFYLADTTTFTTIGFLLWVNGSTGATARVGIWADSNGYPGALLATSTSLGATSGAIAVVSYTLGTPLTLAPGTYWSGLVAQGAPTTAPSFLFCDTQTSQLVAAMLPNLNAGRSLTGITGALPDPFTAGASTVQDSFGSVHGVPSTVLGV